MLRILRARIAIGVAALLGVPMQINIFWLPTRKRKAD